MGLLPWVNHGEIFFFKWSNNRHTMQEKNTTSVLPDADYRKDTRGLVCNNIAIDTSTHSVMQIPIVCRVYSIGCNDVAENMALRLLSSSCLHADGFYIQCIGRQKQQ